MKDSFKAVRNTFLAGLLGILPLYLTIRALGWLFAFLDSSAGAWISVVTGRKIVGAGVLATLAVVFLAGIIVISVGRDRFGRAVDAIFARIPGVGHIYSTIRSLLDPLSHPESRPFRESVWVDVGGGMRIMGLITSSPYVETEGEPPRVNVYIPMSHPYVGFVVSIEPERLRPCRAGFEEVVSWHFSCGSAQPKAYREHGA